MSEERDAHFEGFAKLLWDEIEDKIIVAGDSSKEALFARHSHPLPPAMSREVELLIAQRAYDFALFLFENADPLYLDVKRSYHDRPGEGVHDYHQFIKQLPDIDKWPDK